MNNTALDLIFPAGTLRTRLLKVGARVVETARKIWSHLPSSFLAQDVWGQMYEALVPD